MPDCFFRISKVFLLLLWFILNSEKLEEKSLERKVGVRSGSKSVAIKGKREKSLKGKYHPLFQMCEGFYYSEHLFHLAEEVKWAVQILFKTFREVNSGSISFVFYILRFKTGWHCQ